MNTKKIGVVGLLALAGVASAQSVLVWGTGNQGAGTGAIASWLYGSGEFDSVSFLDQDTGVTFDTLNAYDEVLFFTNGGGDPNNGNVLADFADTGKRLVLATFSWANQGGNTLGGRIISEGISPFVAQGSSRYTPVSIASTDGSPYWESVAWINGYFHDDVVLTPGSQLHGMWTDGTPLLASRYNVVGLNLFPDDTFGAVSGDYRQLFVNALDIPAPGVVGALSVFGLAAFRRRR